MWQRCGTHSKKPRGSLAVPNAYSSDARGFEAARHSPPLYGQVTTMYCPLSPAALPDRVELAAGVDSTEPQVFHVCWLSGTTRTGPSGAWNV